MKRRITIPVAIILLAVVCVLGFTDYSFQSSPYRLRASPMIAYRITGRPGDTRYFPDDSTSIHGCAIVRQTAIADANLQQEVLGILNGRLTYGQSGAMCFEPGIAIRLGTGGDQVDALICLECHRVFFYRNGEVAERVLSARGIARFKEIYPKLFPGHTLDESDPELDRITAARDAERDRQDRVTYASTKP